MLEFEGFEYEIVFNPLCNMHFGHIYFPTTFYTDGLSNEADLDTMIKNMILCYKYGTARRP